MTKPRVRIDMTNLRYGRLVCVLPIPETGRDQQWVFRCDCGEMVVKSGAKVRAGGTRSCGCLQRESAAARRFKHGRSHSRLYNIWANMKARCCNPKAGSFVYYGGRGIRVCAEWLEYVAFERWALQHGYDAALSLDRINNDLGYEPDNCQWVSAKVQSRNRRHLRRFVVDGHIANISEHCERLGLAYSTVMARRKDGWPEERWFDPVRRVAWQNRELE